MLAVLPATLPATSSSAAADRSMSIDGPDQHVSSAATASAATSPMISAIAQAPWLESAAYGEGHLPTATFRSARAECRILHARVVDPRDPGQRVGLLAHLLDAADGGPRLLGDLGRQQRRS